MLTKDEFSRPYNFIYVVIMFIHKSARTILELHEDFLIKIYII